MSAHLFCFYFGILADDTPPVGLAAYAASAIAESEPIPTGIQGFLYDIRTSVIAFMLIFNPDLILNNIKSLPLGLMIFAMALLAMASFTNLTQGYCLTRNKWYEAPFFLLSALILFLPGSFAELLNIDPSEKYYLYFAGVIIYTLTVSFQKLRMGYLKS
jgi:TRAP-type uncharacterized transport system fused permease subunit